MSSFSTDITNWYLPNKRELPWRDTKDPYFIWLSEIILQQTRVDQGLSYYLKFTEHFPSINDLAEADNELVMKLWQGLGYYSRARNLHAAAKTIKNEFNGIFPNNYKDIKSLKGIGNYTAAAISSFAFNLPHAVVDGNVYRLLSRVYNISTPIDSTAGQKEFALLADKLLNKKDPATHNQAIMELGAIVCTPRNTHCDICPLQNSCKAFKYNTIQELPVKEKKTKVRKRYFNYIVFDANGDTAINKRIQKDIWTNLYDFPCIETPKEVSESILIKSKEWSNIIGETELTILEVTSFPKHILSHQIIHARFWEIQINSTKKINLTNETTWIPKTAIFDYAVPRLIDLYINSKKTPTYLEGVR